VLEQPSSLNSTNCAVKQTLTVIGHSFGGPLTQILAGRSLAKVSMAIDPAARSGACCRCPPWTEAKVDTHNPDRGRLLIITRPRDFPQHPLVGSCTTGLKPRLLEPSETRRKSPQGGLLWGEVPARQQPPGHRDPGHEDGQQHR
jgi:hypothetical protein